MKKFFLLPCLLYLVLSGTACRSQGPYPDAPGTLFIRQQICDLNDFKKGFFKPENSLKAHGFLAYSFHRDPQDPKTYILSFKCTDLKKAVEFIRSSNFYFSCVGAGLGQPLFWAGVDVAGLPYRNLTPKAGGIAVARYEVRDYGSWKRDWDAKYGVNINRVKNGSDPYPISLHLLEGRPDVVIVVYSVPDIHRARAFLDPKVDETTSATRKALWLGTNLEEGSF